MSTDPENTSDAGSKQGRNWWGIANSPLVLLVASGIIIGGGAKLYADHQEDVREQTTRRSTLSNLLVEYRQRLSDLERLDAELNKYLGDDPRVTAAIRPVNEAERREFEALSKRVGKREQEIIRGNGTYVPTSPSFANVNIQVIASQIEDSAGVPNLQSGAIQLLGFLNTEPDVLWLFVRAYLPMMTEFYVSRHMMTLSGELPLARGAQLTEDQEKRLGIPRPAPGDLERIMRENDALHANVQEALTNAQGRK